MLIVRVPLSSCLTPPDHGAPPPKDPVRPLSGPQNAAGSQKAAGTQNASQLAQGGPAKPAAAEGAACGSPEEDLALVRGALQMRRDSLQALAARLTCVHRILDAINARRGGALGVHDLEDIAQDVLVRVWQKLEAYRGHVALEFWVHRFCFLEYQNKLRGVRRGMPRAAANPEALLDAARSEAEALDEEMGELETCLAELEPTLEQVLRAKTLDGKGFDQIGAELGIPSATAKSRYYRGLIELRRLVERRKRTS
jgi:RNA polymerase sigma-70 factor (ECF subfamily)